MKSQLFAFVLALATPLLAATPATVVAQPATATAGTQVLANGNRILTTLQQRRAEFRKDPAALRSFVNSELRANAPSWLGAMLSGPAQPR